MTRPVVTFSETPYRHYTVNGPFEHEWTPAEPFGRVASVTQVLGVLDKSGPLVGWATNLTCEGAHRLLFNRKDPELIKPIVAALRERADSAKKDWLAKYLRDRADLIDRAGYRLPKRWRQFQDELRFAGLDHNSATKAAQIRGTEVHQIAEDYALLGKLPVLADFPEEWHGYIRALAGFFVAWDGEFLQSEVMVGSAIHGYAGTCDSVRVAADAEGRRCRFDYKTSRQVYARSHFRQLEAYEHAAVECGDEPTDARAVVCLYADGTHEVGWVPREHMGPQAFLNCLAVYRDEQPLKALEDQAYKARVARERQAKEAQK